MDTVRLFYRFWGCACGYLPTYTPKQGKQCCKLCTA